MAQLNITLNQEEILQLLSNNREDAFRVLLQNTLNSILRAESQDQIQAAPYERSEERTDSRNGFRSRDLQTRKCMLLRAADISHDFIKHKIPKGNLHTNMDLTQRLCVRTDVLIHSSDLFI